MLKNGVIGSRIGEPEEDVAVAKDSNTEQEESEAEPEESVVEQENVEEKPEEGEAEQEESEAEPEESEAEPEEDIAKQEESKKEQENSEKKSTSEPKKEVTITAIDYRAIDHGGWGDGTLIETSDGKLILIDVFHYPCWESLERYLISHGYQDRELYIMISHSDRDHLGKDLDNNFKPVRNGVWNIDLLIQNFNVTRIYLPTSEEYKHVRNTVDAENAKRSKNDEIKIIDIETGYEEQIGQNLKMEVLFVPDDEYKEWLRKKCKEDGVKVDDYIKPNNMSALVRFTTKSGIVYLTFGDAEEILERYVIDLLNKGKIDSLEAHIAKLNHHGGATSNIKEFIKLINAIFYFHTCPNHDIDKNSVKGDSWIAKQVERADKNANVHSTICNGRIRYTIYDDGTIEVSCKRNFEKVICQVKLPDGTIKELTEELATSSSHTLSKKFAELIAKIGKVCTGEDSHEGEIIVTKTLERDKEDDIVK